MSTKQENQGETEQEGMGPLPLVYIILPVTSLVIVVIFILVFWRKKCCHRASENSVGSATHEVVSPSTQYDPVETDNHDETVGK